MKKTFYIIIPIIIVLLGVMAVLITMVLTKGDKNKTADDVAMTGQVLDKENYEQLILKLEDKLKQNDKDVDAYLALADAYYKTGNLDKAISTLETGYAKTSSDQIKAKLDEYLALRQKDNDKKKEDEKASLRINDSLFEVFSSYTYKQYMEKFSIVSEDPTSTGEMKLRFGGLDQDFYFCNTENTIAIDPNTKKVLDDAVPQRIISSGLDKLFSGSASGFDIEKLRSLPGVTDAKVTLDQDTRKIVVDFKYKDCNVLIESDDKGNVSGNDVWNLIKPDLQNLDKEKKYLFSGNLKNATTYQGIVGNTEIKVRQGHNNTNGEVIAQTRTNTDKFVIQLPVGDYTFDINSSGYVRDYYNVHVAGEENNERDFVISNAVSTGSLRVVLTWGSVPRDLDGHLIGTSSSGKSVHVSWMDKSDSVANLDVDYIYGNGCETITLTDTGGTYRYIVNRFSYDGSIGTSGAVIKIYTDDGRITTITPPSNVNAVNWEVFRIENGTIKDINGNQQ